MYYSNTSLLFVYCCCLFLFVPFLLVFVYDFNTSLVLTCMKNKIIIISYDCNCYLHQSIHSSFAGERN